MAKLRVTQVRSLIGRPRDQRRTVKALGLRRIGHSVLHDDNPSLRGMLFKVRHLIDVREGAEE